MKHLNKLLFMFLLAPFFATAQANYQPGVVVNLQGDTLHGFIKYLNWEKSPKSINFRAADGAPDQVFTPTTIKYFSVAVGYPDEYLAYLGPVTNDRINIANMSSGRDTSLRTDTVFLRVLQHGKNMIIFVHSDSQKKRYFIAHNFSEIPVELIYRAYWDGENADGTQKTTYENDYKGQLYAAAAKAGVTNAALQSAVANMRFDEESLLRVVGMINGISTIDKSATHRSHHKPIVIVLAAGLIVAFTIVLIHEFSQAFSE